MGVYRTMRVPGKQVKDFIRKGSPLLFNEALWSTAMATLTQCYSVRGLSVVAGMNISNTLNNVLNVVFLAMGNAVAIVVGQLLGAGKMDKARDTDNKMIAFSVFCSMLVGILMLFMAPVFPRLYNTTDEVRRLATRFIMVQAIFMPQSAFLHATYFTLRSGGKTVITFFFDSVTIWCVSVPIAYILSRYTNMQVVYILAMVQIGDWAKCLIGFWLVKKGVWLQNIVAEKR